MDEAQNILNKIKKFELQKSDLDKFISFLKTLSYDTLIIKSLAEDSIEWLKVISFLLQKYETGKFAIIGDDWRAENIEFQKLKRIIDEIDYDGNLAHKIWGIGGYCHFELINKQEFLEFLYRRIESILLRIVPKISKKEEPIGKTLEQISIVKAKKKKEEPKKLPKIIEEENKGKEKEERLPLFNTNLKHIEIELETTIKKLSKFNKSQEEIEKWVSQFREDKERIYALKLLNHFRYYDDEATIDLYSQTHKNLLFEFDENPKINEFLFVPAGGASSSGASCTYYYRIYNNIHETQTKNPDKLDELKSNTYKYIVFIDDFIGTGKQANKFFKESVDFEKLKAQGIERFYFLTLTGFDEGIKLIESNHKDIKVIFTEKFDERDKVFSEKSKVFSSEEREEAKEIFKNYGKKLCKDMPLGYGNFSALISFKNKCPNHTLPVIWSDARGWFPIFKRFYNL